MAAVFCALTAPVNADWTQYNGVGSDRRTSEAIGSTKWSKSSPKRLWSVETPLGFSSFTVADGKAFTLVSRELEGIEREVCVALDIENGKELWATPMCFIRYGHDGGNSGAKDNKGGDGPRSTPSVSDGRVYVLDSDLMLACLSAKDGSMQWQHNLMKSHAGRNIKWKNASAPLIEGDHVIVQGGGAGQSFLAFDKTSGKLAWKSGDHAMTHATPIATTIHDVRQIIFFTQDGLVSVEPKTGKPLWMQEFPFRVSTAASPVVDGDIVYCSAGYGVGAGAYRISKEGEAFKSEEIWRKEGKLQNHWSTPVVLDGHLYGMFSFKKYGKGPLACVELATGEMKWEEDGFGPGNVILAGEHLLALSDSGELVLVAPSPKSFKAVTRTNVVGGKCWSSPVVSGGKIFARSTKEAVCLDVSGG